MTEEERNEKMAPKSMTSKLNLDGAVSFDDESSDEEQIVKVSAKSFWKYFWKSASAGAGAIIKNWGAVRKCVQINY